MTGGLVFWAAPLIRPPATFSPTDAGEKELARLLPGLFLGSVAASLPSRVPSPRAGGERVAEGRVRGESPIPWDANSGGPMSRTRTERIRSRLPGRDVGDIVVPRRLRLALDFGTADPCATMRRLLKKRGFDDPNELRPFVGDIPAPMLCLASSSNDALRVSEAAEEDVLREAFLLGLCTAVFFDPSRTVLWTTSSLTRRLDLFDGTGFYA